MTAAPWPVPTDRLFALAAGLGVHALPAFGLLLGALLALTAAAWWASRRVLSPRDRVGPVRKWRLLASALAGFGVVVAAAALFAAIAGHLQSDGTLARFDEALTAALRSQVGIATLRTFAVLTHFGDVLTLTLLFAAVGGLLCRARRWSLALCWVLAVGGNALLNPLLKRIFERVRPLHEHGLVSESGFSFPSGHSSGSTVAYGMLAYLALRLLPPRWHLPTLLAAVAVVFTVGSSRVFLQVHFASDVAAGFASGAAWLVVCIASAESSRLWRRRA